MQPYSCVQSLSGGARIALVAPSGPLRGPVDVEHAIENVELFGWEPVIGAHVLARDGYLAGSDAERLEDLNRALCDDSIDAIWCLRGGYGVTRILDGIAYDAVRRRPKAIIGYSDITALHAAIGREGEQIVYHGPTARSVITPFTRNSFERAVSFGMDPCGTAHSARTLRGGVVRGRLMGGNLALVSALIGTRYCPDLRDAILVLEDVNEPVYRIDRMLQHLLMAGALDSVVAIAFGQCTACDSDDADDTSKTRDETSDVNDVGRLRRTLDHVLCELAQRLDIPCVAGLPVGHIDEQWTLPLGAVAQLDADAITLTVESF